MKIMKQFSRKVGDTDYYKYLLNIPPKAIKESGLEGKELKIKVEKGRIVIEKD